MFSDIINTPLSNKQIFKLSCTTFQKLSSEISEIFFLLFMPLVFLQALVYTFWQDDALFILDFIQNGGSIYSETYVEATMSLLVNQMILFVIIPSFLSIVGIVAISKLVFEFILIDSKPIPSSAIKFAFSVYTASALIEILNMSLVSLATLAFIIPGVYLSIIWRFYLQATVFRKQKGFKAFAYSSLLVKKNISKCLLVFISITVLSFAVSLAFSVFEAVFANVITPVIVQIVYQVVISLFLIFSEVVITVLFINLDSTTIDAIR